MRRWMQQMNGKDPVEIERLIAEDTYERKGIIIEPLGLVNASRTTRS